MRILTFVQGQYGDRIVGNVSSRSPSGWSVETLKAPPTLPPVVDEPEEYLPDAVPEVDLLVAMTESMGAAQLVTTLAKLSKARSVIMPVDNPSWLLPGMKLQIGRELEREGIASVFPKTFCTLTERGYGFRRGYEEYGDALIAEFATLFGAPRLEVRLDPEGQRIMHVLVIRGAPCDSTHFVAEKLAGMLVEEVLPQAGLMAHYYPCMASMQRELLDDGVFEPLMNISGYVVNEELERVLGSLTT